MLIEYGGSEECGLQAVNVAMPQHSTKGSQGFPALLPIVGEPPEELLNFERCIQLPDDVPFLSREHGNVRIIRSRHFDHPVLRVSRGIDLTMEHGFVVFFAIAVTDHSALRLTHCRSHPALLKA